MIEAFVVFAALVLAVGLSIMWVASVAPSRVENPQATCSDIYDLRRWSHVAHDPGVVADVCHAPSSSGRGSEACEVRLPGDTMLDWWGGYGTSGAKAAVAFSSSFLPTYGATMRLTMVEALRGPLVLVTAEGTKLNWQYTFEGPTPLQEVFQALHLLLISSANPPESIQGRGDVFRDLLAQGNLNQGAQQVFKIQIEYANTVWEDETAAACNEIDLNPGTGVVLLRYGAYEL